MSISEKYMETVLSSFRLRRGNRPIYKEEADAVVDWVQIVEMDVIILEAILAGKMLVEVTGGEVVFMLSQEGSEEGERLSKTDWGEEMFKKLSEKPLKKSATLCDRILLLMYG